MATVGNDSPQTRQTQTTRINTQVNGIGAKIGTDFAYSLYDGFSLVGDFGLTGAAADYTLDRFFVSDSRSATTTINYFPEEIKKMASSRYPRPQHRLQIHNLHLDCYMASYKSNGNTTNYSIKRNS